MDREGLFWLGTGPLAALVLGMALVPLRGLTPASNLSFAFMALTIVVAEFGGRWAATATALVSALSLDFFLTQPYLRLAIEDNHDVIAFLGLTMCGLIAAALGSRRGERISALRSVEKHRNLLRAVLRDWNGEAPIGAQLTSILRACREAFPLAAAVLRDDRGRVLASSQPADASRAAPEPILQPDSLRPGGDPDRQELDWSLALPDTGGRIALLAGSRRMGWLEVWGNGATANAESRRGLSDVARLVALLLSATNPRTQEGD